MDKNNQFSQHVTTFHEFTLPETEMGWYKKPVVIIFTDGSWMIPVCDDECNDGGSILYHNLNDEEQIIYTD